MLSSVESNVQPAMARYRQYRAILKPAPRTAMASGVNGAAAPPRAAKVLKPRRTTSSSTQVMVEWNASLSMAMWLTPASAFRTRIARSTVTGLGLSGQNPVRSRATVVSSVEPTSSQHLLKTAVQSVLPTRALRGKQTITSGRVTTLPTMESCTCAWSNMPRQVSAKLQMW